MEKKKIAVRKVLFVLYVAAAVIAVAALIGKLWDAPAWLRTLCCGIVAWISSKPGKAIIKEWFGRLLEKIRNLIAYIVEWVVVIARNIDFLLSDVVGALVGIWLGKAVASVLGAVFPGVIVGLAVAGLAAAGCCAIANRFRLRVHR